MSARRWALAGILVCSGALAACKREVPHVEASPPPDVTLTPDPQPPGAAPADSAPAVPHHVTPAQQGVAAPGRRAGQRVQVEWHGKCYAARIVSVPRPGAYFITYEGYDHSWDETVGENRICK